MIKTDLESIEDVFRLLDTLEVSCDLCKKPLSNGYVVKPVTVTSQQYIRTICNESCLWLDSFTSELQMELELVK